MSEESLCLCSAEQSLADVFLLHRHRLRNLLNYRLSSSLERRFDLDDVLQEIFLAASRRLEAGHSPTEGHEYLWLRMIAIQTFQNLCRYHRAAKRSLRREAGVREESWAVKLGDSLLATVTSPSQKLARKEAYELVESAMTKLSENDREVVQLRHFEEMTNFEVAETLKLSTRAASIRYIRAIARLKQLVDDGLTALT